VSEVSVSLDPLPFVKLEAPLADRDEVIRQQGVQAIGVGVQLGVVEGLSELADVGCHVVILSLVASEGRTSRKGTGQPVSHRDDQLVGRMQADEVDACLKTSSKV
jgi:hypothetical protein